MISKFSLIQDYITEQLSKPGSHGLDHTLRVTHLCGIIGDYEKANPDIVIPAALLHDIARPQEEKTKIPHEIAGSAMAESFLKSIGYNSELIPAITHAILTHRFSSSLPPQSLEAKILSDADKLDASGAIGLARAFITAGERGGDITDGILHIHEKLLKLSDRMYTHTARSIALERHSTLKNFLDSLVYELDWSKK
jgi:uncharacterized protein